MQHLHLGKPRLVEGEWYAALAHGHNLRLTEEQAAALLDDSLRDALGSPERVYQTIRELEEGRVPTPEPRATPARDYRIRLHLDRIDGPIWLRLLAQLGYAVGVAGDECYGIAG